MRSASPEYSPGGGTGAEVEVEGATGTDDNEGEEICESITSPPPGDQDIITSQDGDVSVTSQPQMGHVSVASQPQVGILEIMVRVISEFPQGMESREVRVEKNSHGTSFSFQNQRQGNFLLQ